MVNTPVAVTGRGCRSGIDRRLIKLKCSGKFGERKVAGIQIAVAHMAVSQRYSGIQRGQIEIKINHTGLQINQSGEVVTNPGEG